MISPPGYGLTVKCNDYVQKLEIIIKTAEGTAQDMDP
jgi:hypothetical protein